MTINDLIRKIPINILPLGLESKEDFQYRSYRKQYKIFKRKILGICGSYRNLTQIELSEILVHLKICENIKEANRCLDSIEISDCEELEIRPYISAALNIRCFCITHLVLEY